MSDRPSLEDWGVTEDEARALLSRQMCPACGEGPWKSPLTHASKRHGIDAFTMRDICGVTTTQKVTDREFSERLRAKGQGRDMSAVGTRGKGTRRKQRFTGAGIGQLSANLKAFSDSEEGAEQRARAAALSKSESAIAKQAASLRTRWEGLSAEQRAAETAHLIPWTTDRDHLDTMRRKRWGGT